ncbi:hypothetical protein E2C01_041074 [Portunus trituberculatus]|uniref:Uncharacterized protein n=1 Tax=Portunus trituberculatus TaxID=210409 RepID=A0A5B7FLG7_PORTR|nr:hypothetical protein [Portunus trituberculatus]
MSVGLDEEVRQLLDLKGQVAQRDLHQLKTHATQDNQTHASTSLGNDRLGKKQSHRSLTASCITLLDSLRNGKKC